MTSSPTRILVLFLDGVGIGPDDPDRNPFLQAELPAFRGLWGGRVPTLSDPAPAGSRGVAFPMDATLGVEGLPQSGTGQVALLTGRNAPRIFGRHFGPWPPVSLRPLLAEANLLRKVREAGRATAFANAYPAGWPGTLPTRRHAAPPLAALAAGVLNRHAEALAREEAVSSEIVNDGWIRHFGLDHLPRVTPGRAGRTLARIAGSHELTFYAHYQTDHAGHRGGMRGGVEALERVDGLVEGVLAEAPPGLLVLGVSDHGNVEDVTQGHTRNPALGFLAWAGGEAAPPGLPEDLTPGLLEDLTPGLSEDLTPGLPEDLTEVAPWILGRLGVGEAGVGRR